MVDADRHGPYSTPVDRKLIPVACTLSDAGAMSQAAEWIELVADALETERVDGGVAMTFPAGEEARVRDLADREAACCSFLAITTARTDAGLRLVITSADADALPVIESLAGLGS